MPARFSIPGETKPYGEGRGMTECEQVGIGGNCGLDCPVYLDGGCECAEDMIVGADAEDQKVYKGIYGEVSQ
jgi:hypothetical protein